MNAAAYLTLGLLLLVGIMAKNSGDLVIVLVLFGPIAVAIMVRGYLFTRPDDERFENANALGRKCAISVLVLALVAPMFFHGIDLLPVLGFFTFLPSGYVLGVAFGLLRSSSG